MKHAETEARSFIKKKKSALWKSPTSYEKLSKVDVSTAGLIITQTVSTIICGFHVFWVAGQFIISVCVIVFSVVPWFPCVKKPKQMAIRKKKQHGLLIVKKARTLRKPKHRLHLVVNTFPTRSYCLLCSLDSGFGKVPLCGERNRHAAVHSVSHAGESATSGVQSERWDPHQTGPVLCSGRHSQAAGDRSRFSVFSLLRFVQCQYFLFFC